MQILYTGCHHRCSDLSYFTSVDLRRWLGRLDPESMYLLVISCPCALVISVPLGFFGGIGASSKIGILVKGSNYLEAVAEMTTIVFDKTGTLTKGEFKVSEVQPSADKNNTIGKEELLEIAAYGEGYSNHPIANSIREAYGKTLSMERVTDTEEIAGHGIHTFIDGREVYLGNAKLMDAQNIAYTENKTAGTVVYVVCNNVFAGSIVISDTVKEGSKDAIRDMKQVGVKKTVMLTGDRQAAADAVAAELGIDEVHAELLPADKVGQVEKLLGAQNEKRDWHSSVMVSTMHRYSQEQISESPWEAWVRMLRSRQRTSY